MPRADRKKLHMPESRYIVVVDGISTGRHYPSVIRQFGCQPVHVASKDLLNLRDNIHLIGSSYEDMLKQYVHMFSEERGPDVLAEKLRRLQPVAVVAGTESGVELADFLCEALGLPGNGFAGSAVRRDKFLMHQRLGEAGLRSLRTCRCDTWETARAWATDLDRWPIVVKPPRSAATQGVMMCDSFELLETTFNHLINSRDIFNELIDEVLLQECAQGTEFVVNTVSREGRHFISSVWQYEKRVIPNGPPLYSGIKLLCTLDDAPEGLIDYTLQVLDVLGVRFGPAHTEIMVTEDGPVLIESGARPMGGDSVLAQSLQAEALGQTQLGVTLEALLAPDKFENRLDVPYAASKFVMCKFFISDREGDIEAVPAVNLLMHLKTFYCADFSEVVQNSRMIQTVDLMTCCGSLSLCGEDEAMVLHDYELACLMEKEMPNQLFTLRGSEEFRPDAFKLIPDELWLKPEETAQRDGTMIVEALGIGPGQDLLDCPCGDCRVGVHIAAAGCRYVGIDINVNFIDKARQRFAEAGLQGDLRAGDMLEFEHDQAFDIAVNWFNSFGYVDVEFDFEILRMFFRALKPGGRLLLETPNRKNLLNNLVKKTDTDGDSIEVRWEPVSEQCILPIKIQTEDGERIFNMFDRIYTPGQLEVLLTLAGFSLVRVWGDDFGPFTDDTRRVILLAEKNEDSGEIAS